jgi:RimJ/RimL family protein N-acetyltransferase
MKSKIRLSFKPVDHAHRSLVHEWLYLPHVAVWFYGDGLRNTLTHLDEFLQRATPFKYWIAFDKEHPFAFLITTKVEKKDAELASWRSEEGEAITLDMLIGDLNYLGKGLSTSLIHEFLKTQFPSISEVLIDPEATNLRAIHVYKKAGFIPLGEFIPAHSPNLHYMMRLNWREMMDNYRTKAAAAPRL